MLPDNHARDPQRDMVFHTKAEAAAYTGLHGQTTYTFDLAADCYEHRAHDGETRGGILIASTSGPAAVYPTASAVNFTAQVIPANTDPALVITHNLGYNPMVQTIDHTQAPAELVEVEVTYIDMNTISLQAGATALNNVEVLIR